MVESVKIEQHGNIIELVGRTEPVVLCEADAFIFIQCSLELTVFLNDIPLETKKSLGLYYATFSLLNSTGFQKLEIKLERRSIIWHFFSQSGKAKWDSIVTMAKLCEKDFFAGNGSFVYRSREGADQRVGYPETLFNWIADRIVDIEQVLADIDKNPGCSRSVSHKVTIPRSKVLISQTIKFLSANSSYLEEIPNGILRIGDKEYSPNRVITGVRKNNPTQLEHIQIRNFLLSILQSITEYSRVYQDVKNLDYIKRISRLLNLSIFRCSIHSVSLAFYPLRVPTNLQVRDSRYATLRAYAIEYFTRVGDITGEATNIRSSIKASWEIYQSFVAHYFGYALKLEYNSPNHSLRTTRNDMPILQNTEYALYYDQKPPSDLLESWRETSGRKANERPDIILVEKKTGRVLLFDCKFRIEQDGVQAKNEDLFEMQGYMNSFGINTAGIIFPGSGIETILHRSKNKCLFELPLNAESIMKVGLSSHCQAFSDTIIKLFIIQS